MIIKKLTVVALIVAGLCSSATTVEAANGDWKGVNGCYVWSGKPVKQYWPQHRRYAAHAGVWVWCDRNRTVTINAYLSEADVGPDQNMTPRNAWSHTVQRAQTWEWVGSLAAWCQNLDAVGKEEVYSRAYVNVGGINSAWTRSHTLSDHC